MNLLAIGFGVFLLVHGFAHLVGFVVPWRLAELEEAPYATTLLGERVDVGDHGIRAVGAVWLALAIAFAVAAVGLWGGLAWWRPLTLVAASISLAFSVLGWPEAKIGIPVNVAILVALYLPGGFA